MKIRKIAGWFTVVFVTLLAFALAWLWTADLGVFKPQIEQWVSEKTGREFVIDGEFHVDLARHAVVIAEDVRFQNAEWADEPYMLEVGRAEVRVDLRSIFDGPILVELIDIDDVEIRLRQSEGGEPNWALPLQDEVDAATEDVSESGFEVLFKHVDIDKLHLSFESQNLEKPLDLRIDHLNQRHRDDDFLELDIQAMLGDREVRLKGELGTWAALLVGEDIHFDLQGQFDTFDIESSGWIDNIARPYRPSFEFSANGPDVSDLTRMLGIGEDAEGNIDLSGTLIPQDNGPLVLAVKGNIGEAKIEAAGSFSDLQDFEQVDVDLLASGPDLGRLLRLAGIDQVREAPFMIDIDATRQGSSLVIEQGRMVFADAEFDLSARIPDFPSVDDASITIQINGPDIERFRYITGLPGSAGGAFSIGFELELAPGGFEVFQLDLATSLGRVNANGQLGTAPEYFGSTLNFQVTSGSLAQLGSAYGARNLPDSPISAQGSVVFEEGGIRTAGPVTIIADDLSASAAGLVVLSEGITGSDLSFNLVGPSLAALTGAFGVAESIPDEAFDISVDLQVRKEGYRLTNVTGMLGSSNLKLDGLLVPAAGLTGSSIAFTLGGPAFEELIDELGDVELLPGPYELSGTIALQADMIRFDKISLDRENGQVQMNMELGVPVSRRWVNFDISASGTDVRSVLRDIKGYQAEAVPFFVDTHGELRETKLSIDKYEIGIADARAQASGDLDFGDSGSSTRFSFTGDIPSLARLGRLDGHRLRDQRITWDANVVGADGVLTIADLELTLGESDVNGFVRYTIGDVQKLEVDINSRSIVFGELLEEQEVEYDAEPEFDDGRLIPDITIPFDALKTLDASVIVRIGALSRDALHLRNIDLQVELQDGVLEVHNASFDARSGWVKARGKLEPADGTGKASLELVARNFNLGLLQVAPDDAMTGDFDINLDATGVDARTLAGNLNGVVFINTGGGRMPGSRALHMIYGDMLTEILSSINPFYKTDSSVTFKCIVLPLEVTDGSLTSNPNSFISTDKIRLTMKSTINLKTEAIDVNIRTTPQRGLSISGGELFNPFIKVVGTLAAPRLAVDEAGVLISGGAAVATGGLSVLAKATWDRLSRSREPCIDTAGKGRQALGDRFPDIE